MIKSVNHGSNLVKKKKNSEEFQWFSFANIERRKFVCVACSSRFDTRFLMNLHRITQCTKLPFKCDVCELRFSMKSRLEYHQRIHGVIKLPKKEESDAIPTSKQQINIPKTREVINDLNITYQCSKCNLSFVGKRKLERHERIHSDKKYYKCDRCHLGFFWKSNYNRHRKNSCVRKEYACEQCNRTFSKKLHLMRHQTSHAKVHKYLKEEIDNNAAELEAGPSTSSQGTSAEKDSYPDKDQKIKVVPRLQLSPTNSRSKRLQDTLKGPEKYEPFIASDNKSSQEDGRDVDYEPKKKKKLEHRYRCKTCGTGFKWKCDLARHWRTHASIKPFLCDKCDLGFNWKSNLVRHQKRIHMGTEGFVCDTCGRGFVKKYHLSRHRSNDCGKSTSKSDNDNSDGALKPQSSDRAYDCNAVSDEGDYGCKTELNPVVVQVHPDGKGHNAVKDDLTDPSGSSSEELDAEFENMSKITPEVNIVYLHAFNDQVQSYQKEEYNSDKRTITQASESATSSKVALDLGKLNKKSQNKKETKEKVTNKRNQETISHGTKNDDCIRTSNEPSPEKRTKKGPKEFTCCVCNRVFSRKSCHTQHERSHYKQRLQCEWCHRSFDRNSVLVRHQRIHTGEKPYQCEGCLSYFRQKSQLVQHRKIHTGVKPYECEVCKSRFNRRSILVRHKMIHTGEKPFECEVCHLCFNQKSILVQHLKIHSGLKPYKCTKCNYSFTQKWNFQRHKQRVHTTGRQFSIKCNSCDISFPRKKILIQHQEIHRKKVVIRISDAGCSKKKLGTKKNTPNLSVFSEKRENFHSISDSEKHLQPHNLNVVGGLKIFEKSATTDQEVNEKEFSAFEDKGSPVKIYIRTDHSSMKIEDKQDTHGCPKEMEIDRECLKDDQCSGCNDGNVEDNHVHLDFQSHKDKENCNFQKELHLKDSSTCIAMKSIEENNDVKTKVGSDGNDTSFSRDIATDDFRTSKETPTEELNKNGGNKIPQYPEQVKNEQFPEKFINQDECSTKNMFILENNHTFQKTSNEGNVESVKTFQETKECRKINQENIEIPEEFSRDIKETAPVNVNFRLGETDCNNKILIVHKKEDAFENSYPGKNSNSPKRNIFENQNLLGNESDKTTGNNNNDEEALKSTLKKNFYKIQESEEKIKTNEKHKCKFRGPSISDEENILISYENVNNEETKFKEKEAIFTHCESISSCKHPDLTDESQRKFTNDKSIQSFKEYHCVSDKKHSMNIHPQMDCIKGLTQIEDSAHFGISEGIENNNRYMNQVSGLKHYDIKKTDINSYNPEENFFDKNMKNESLNEEGSYFIEEIPPETKFKKNFNLKTNHNAQPKRKEVKLAIRKIRRSKDDLQSKDNYEILKDVVHRKNARRLKRLKDIPNYKKSKSSKKFRHRDDSRSQEENEKMDKMFLDLKESVITALTSLKIHDDCDQDLNTEPDNVAENNLKTENNLIKNETISSDNAEQGKAKDEKPMHSCQVSKEEKYTACDAKRALSDVNIENERVSSNQHEGTNENNLKLEYVANRKEDPKRFEGRFSNPVDNTDVIENILHTDKCYVVVEKIEINQEYIQEKIPEKKYPYRIESASQLDQDCDENFRNENKGFLENTPNGRESLEPICRSKKYELPIKNNYKTHEEVNTYDQENFLEGTHKLSDNTPVDQNAFEEYHKDDVEYFLEKINSKREMCPEESKHTESSNKKTKSDQDFAKCDERTTYSNNTEFGESTYQNAYYYPNTDQVSSGEMCTIDPNPIQETADNQVSSSGLSPDRDQSTIRSGALAESYSSNGNHATVGRGSTNSSDPFHCEENMYSLPAQNSEFYDGSNIPHKTNDSNKNVPQYTDIEQIFFPERLQNDQNFIGYENLQPYQGYNLRENIQSQVIFPKETFIPNNYKPATQAIPSYKETFSQRNSIPNDIAQISGLFYPEYNNNNQSSHPEAENPNPNNLYNVESYIPYKEACSQNFVSSDKTHTYQDTNWNREVPTIPHPKETLNDLKFDNIRPNPEHVRHSEDPNNAPNNPPFQETFNHIYGNHIPDYYDNPYPTYNEDACNYSLRQEKVRTYSVRHEEIHTVQDLIRLEKTYAYPAPHKIIPAPVPVQSHCIEPGYGSPVRYREVLFNKQRDIQMNVPVIQGSARFKAQPLQFPPKVTTLPSQNSSKLNVLPASIPATLNTPAPKGILENNSHGSPRQINQGSALLNVQISQNQARLNGPEPNLLIKPAPQYPINHQFYHHQVLPTSPKFRFPSASNQNQKLQAKVSTFNQSISLKGLQDQEWCKKIIFGSDINKRIRFGPGNASRMYANDPKEVVPETLIGCDKCDQKFNRKEDLIRHRFTVHEKVRAARFCNMMNR